MVEYYFIQTVGSDVQHASAVDCGNGSVSHCGFRFDVGGEFRFLFFNTVLIQCAKSLL